MNVPPFQRESFPYSEARIEKQSTGSLYHREREWIQAKMRMLVRAGKAVATLKQGDRKESVPAWALKAGSLE